MVRWLGWPGSIVVSIGIDAPSSSRKTAAQVASAESRRLKLSSKVWRPTGRRAPATGDAATSSGGTTRDGAQPANTSPTAAARPGTSFKDIPKMCEEYRD